jgi:hypothetical protein
MSKPFQFSMRRLLGAVVWFCLAAWQAAFLNTDPLPRNADGIIFGSIVCVGGGFGCLVGRTVLGAGLGAAVAIDVLLTIHR